MLKKSFSLCNNRGSNWYFAIWDFLLDQYEFEFTIVMGQWIHIHGYFILESILQNHVSRLCCTVNSSASLISIFLSVSWEITLRFIRFSLKIIKLLFILEVLSMWSQKEIAACWLSQNVFGKRRFFCQFKKKLLTVFSCFIYNFSKQLPPLKHILALPTEFDRWFSKA